jgi:hypothetical protein
MAELVAYTGQERNSNKILDGKPEGRDCLAHLGLKMDLGKIGTSKDQEHVLVKMVMNLQVPLKAQNFLTRRATLLHEFKE